MCIATVVIMMALVVVVVVAAVQQGRAFRALRDGAAGDVTMPFSLLDPEQRTWMLSVHACRRLQ